MPELKITDDTERELVLSALISHAFKCKETIKLHNETKIALKEKAIERIVSFAAQSCPLNRTKVAP